MELAAVLKIFEAFSVDLTGDVPLVFFLAVVPPLAIAFGIGLEVGVLRDLALGEVPSRFFRLGLVFVSPSRRFFLLVASFLLAGFCFFKAFKGHSSRAKERIAALPWQKKDVAISRELLFFSRSTVRKFGRHRTKISGQARNL